MDPEMFRNSPAGRPVKAIGGYWAFMPNPLPPALTWTPELVAVLSEADRALGELAGLGRSLLNPHLLIRPFVRREAVLSSHIGGTQVYRADEVLRTIEEPLSSTDNPPSGEMR
jgi:Fic family protein